MLNKIAVILRGHKRTWEYTKSHLLSFFDFYAFTVDYYVILWNTPNLSIQSILEDFNGKNLKQFLVEPIPQERSVYGPWLGPSYLAGKISKYVFLQEMTQGHRYDCIIDTRPDVCFKRSLDNDHNLVPFPMSVGTSGVNHSQKSMDDLIFLTNSMGFAFWSTRNRFDHDMFFNFEHQLPYQHHSAAFHYASLYDHFIYQIPWFHTIIVRPNIQDFLTADYNIYEASLEAMGKWALLTKQEKQHVLECTGISAEEYTFHLQ